MSPVFCGTKVVSIWRGGSVGGFDDDDAVEEDVDEPPGRASAAYGCMERERGERRAEDEPDVAEARECGCGCSTRAAAVATDMSRTDRAREKDWRAELSSFVRGAQQLVVVVSGWPELARSSGRVSVSQERGEFRRSLVKAWMEGRR